MTETTSRAKVGDPGPGVPGRQREGSGWLSKIVGQVRGRTQARLPRPRTRGHVLDHPGLLHRRVDLPSLRRRVAIRDRISRCCGLATRGARRHARGGCSRQDVENHRVRHLEAAGQLSGQPRPGDRRSSASRRPHRFGPCASSRTSCARALPRAHRGPPPERRQARSRGFHLVLGSQDAHENRPCRSAYDPRGPRSGGTRALHVVHATPVVLDERGHEDGRSAR